MKYLDFNVVRLLWSYGLAVDGLDSSNVCFSDSIDNIITDFEWEWLKNKYYRKDWVALIGSGFIDFTGGTYVNVVKGYTDQHIGHPDAIKRVPSYDEFLNIQRESVGKSRKDIARIYFEAGSFVVCRGKIQQFNHRGNKICIEKVTVYNPHSLDVDWNMYEGVLNHIWVDSSYFEGLGIGDNIEFDANIYPYLKTGNGKQIDYGLEVSGYAKRISEYYWPSKNDIHNRIKKKIKCATCLYNEHCYGHCLV